MTDAINIQGFMALIIKTAAIIISLFYLIAAVVLSQHLNSLKKTIVINSSLVSKLSQIQISLARLLQQQLFF